MRSTSLTGRNRKLIPVLLGFLVLNLIALAQDIPAAKPETVGLSSDRLERIATAVQHNIDDKRIAGAVTLVVRHGKVAWFKAQGMADREAAKPMPADAMFRICSMTKPIEQMRNIRWAASRSDVLTSNHATCMSNGAGNRLVVDVVLDCRRDALQAIGRESDPFHVSRREDILRERDEIKDKKSDRTGMSFRLFPGQRRGARVVLPAVRLDGFRGRIPGDRLLAEMVGLIRHG